MGYALRQRRIQAGAALLDGPKVKRGRVGDRLDVVGGREVWQTLQDEMGLKSGETSRDGKWSLITTSCLGVCGVGPVIIVDEDMYGNVKPDQVAGILARYSG
jgi:hypothetical protein